MKRRLRALGCGSVMTGLLVLVVLGSGCRTSFVDEPVFTEYPSLTGAPGDTNRAQPSAAAPAAPAPLPAAPPTGDTHRLQPAALTGEATGRFRVNDTVTVNFSGVSEVIPPHDERIKEDGTLTLFLVGAVTAVGKTPGELQKELQERYRKYYPNIVVTVKSFELVYYVGGEVKSPGRQSWIGELTVTQAIQSVGDFTDFAAKTKVQLIRGNGTTITVNCKKAIQRPDLDPKVMPGDKIHVPRRWF